MRPPKVFWDKTPCLDDTEREGCMHFPEGAHQFDFEEGTLAGKWTPEHQRDLDRAREAVFVPAAPAILTAWVVVVVMTVAVLVVGRGVSDVWSCGFAFSAGASTCGLLDVCHSAAGGCP